MKVRVLSSISLAALGAALGGCDAGPRPIVYGQDECVECRMAFADRHYGAELITTRGKVLKFDDIGCLLRYRQREPGAAGARAVIIDFNRPNIFLPADSALILQHRSLRSPMGSGLAAFASAAELDAARAQLGSGGEILAWSAAAPIP